MNTTSNNILQFVGPPTNKATDALKDATGRYRTKSLFKETNKTAYTPIFTLKDEDDPDTGEISIKRKYLEIADPTEYTVALRLLGSWDHWQKLCGCKWFKEIVEDLRAELRIKLNSEALDRIMTLATTSSTKAYDANKFVFELTTDNPKGTKRGRPSKYERSKALKESLSLQDDVDTDALRIGVED